MGLLVIAFASLAAVAAGASTAGAATSWAKQANAICDQIEAEIDKIPEPETLAEIAVLLPKIHALGKRERDRIAALPRPVAQRARIVAYVKGFDPVLRIVKQMITPARRGDAKAFDALVDRGNRLASVNDARGRALGARSCAD